MSGRALLAVALVAGALSGVPPARAGCPAVRTRGGWTLTDLPSFADTTATGSPYDTDQAGHPFASKTHHSMPLGAPARHLVTNGVRLARTVDTGCTWRPVFATDTADPANAVAHLHPQYVVASMDSRRDMTYVLYANNDIWTGLGANLAGQPYVLARSTDGGVTWRSDLLRATLPGVTQTTPVLGDGTSASTVVVSPADPRVAYVLVRTRDPRSVDPTAAQPLDGGLYVTRDRGATWSYATKLDTWAKLAADPVDPAVVYAATNREVVRLTVGATATTSAVLYRFPADEITTGVDVVRAAHGPTRLLTTSWWYDSKLQLSLRRLHWSADGGRSWLRLPVPLPFAGTWSSQLVGERAWLTTAGDVVALADVVGTGPHITMVLRWDARRRAWRKSTVEALPLRPGWTNSGMTSIVPVDTARRWFAVKGNSADVPHGLWAEVVGVWDSAR